MASRPRIRIVLDWDGTLTIRDTLHVVAAIGYKTNKHRVPPPPSWDQIVQAYMADYTRHQDAYRPPRQDRHTIPLESAWLASLRGVEVRSVQRVVDAGIFANVTEGDVWREAEAAARNGEVRLREGWWDVLTAASLGARPGAGACHNHDGRDEGVPVPAVASSPSIAIISVNWSAAFIRACLSAATTTAITETGDLQNDNSPEIQTQTQIQTTVVNSLPILANNLLPRSPYDGHYSTTAAPAGGAGIHTSADKRAALQRLQRLHWTEDQGQSGRDTVVYVGDSPTDLDCLVSADVGVCVRDEPLGSGQRELQETLERVGVEVRRLDLGEWSKIRRRSESGRQEGGGGGGGGEACLGGDNKRVVVWWVADLKEVARFVDMFCYQGLT
ncbi:glutamate carboxypeptidase II [Fonsecaea nubica]|uniref:Glutamate carboxypeptidase II n=1 Tax=Fonsecaea nubica TaxID=856822 RepID=A0A178CW66_9EURO|nr:glutamate carboxypeptidase II [Fonsecaea nubica]OAL33494.1 glutamate carboxypeptidase II [Fonsecaea nubica]